MLVLQNEIHSYPKKIRPQKCFPFPVDTLNDQVPFKLKKELLMVTKTGCISKRLTVSSKDSKEDSHLALTLVNQKTAFKWIK